MNEPKRKPQVTLEDLLQLKRAERPSAEFWPRFEQELRAKQLAALVQPVRPWYHGIASRKLLLRVYAPLGAAAVVALSFGVFQRPDAPKVALAQSTSTVATPVAVVENVVAISPARAERVENEFKVAAVEMPAVADREVKRESSAELVVTSSESDSANSSTSEQLLLAGTATVKAAGQALAQMVGLIDDNAGRTESVQNNVVEPLTQVSTPRDNRRSRLLAYMVAYDPHAAGSQDSARSRERITRRISDESVYDSISRLGVSGDRVSIKF
ncbi:MAG: hypothetical protein QM715_06975 [Nibricoccus sp.]